MPINNALTPEGQNALGAAFGYYPQLRRNRTVQDPRLAAEMPLQFLRGRLAATLGLPSDVANLVRSPMPMEMYGDVDYGPQTQVPYGSQELLRTLPFPPQGPAQTAAANVGAAVPLTPMEALQAARAARQAALAGGRTLGPTAARMAEGYLQRQGLIMPLDVYHGTPHTLPPTARNPLGEFDASKIGTGEGAQMYGQGIYTAENPAVAKQYQKALSNPEVVLKDGTRISNPTLGSPEDVAKAWLEEAYLSGDKTPFDTAIKKVSMLRNSANSPKQFDGALDVLNNWKKSGASVDLGGNLYKVDLPDAMIPKMLDYDKPLSKQDPYVRDIIAKAFPSGYINGKFVDPLNSRATGRAMLDQLDMIANKRNEPGFMSAETALRQAGIPGIKYLDEGSRAEGKGTRNFVTFPGEEKNLRILERNGQPVNALAKNK